MSLVVAKLVEQELFLLLGNLVRTSKNNLKIYFETTFLMCVIPCRI